MPAGTGFYAGHHKQELGWSGWHGDFVARKVDYMQQKPRVFIGSSTEGLGLAEALFACLQRHTEPTLWQGGGGADGSGEEIPPREGLPGTRRACEEVESGVALSAAGGVRCKLLEEL